MKKTKYPIIDNDRCILCKKCIKVCPEGAISTTWKSSCSKCVKYCSVMDVPCKPHVIVIDYQKCNSCGRCIAICPNDAIEYKN